MPRTVSSLPVGVAAMPAPPLTLDCLHSHPLSHVLTSHPCEHSCLLTHSLWVLDLSSPRVPTSWGSHSIQGSYARRGYLLCSSLLPQEELGSVEIAWSPALRTHASHRLTPYPAAMWPTCSTGRVLEIVLLQALFHQ